MNNLFAGADGLAQVLAGQAVQVEVGGMRLHFVDHVMEVPMRTTAVVDVALEVVVSDACIEALKADGWVPTMSYLDCMYSVGRLDGDQTLAEFLGRAFPVPVDWPYYRDTTSVGGSFMSSAWPCDVVYTGQEMADQASGLRLVITYLAVYIGFVLLMTTAAILAIQQLTETTDSLPHYRRLSTLGAASPAVLRSLCVQTGVYFLAPLALAASHTARAVSVVNRALFPELGIEIGGSTALACGLVVGVYAIDFALTYLASRSYVKDVLA